MWPTARSGHGHLWTAPFVRCRVWNTCAPHGVAANVMPKLSLLDLATVGRDQPVRDALADTVTLAQRADELGAFERLWFAEHHNMSSIASAATSVLIGHVADRMRVLRSLQGQLKDLRARCEAPGTSKECGILQGLAAPAKSRGVSRRTGVHGSQRGH